jgi:tetratricopeptide (TPR) repeat protein
MAKCQLAQKNYAAAERYTEKAQSVYPQEAQSYHLSGLSKIQQKAFASAANDFSAYERMLPGNPNTLFFKGYALEGMQQKDAAAEAYYGYLQAVSDGDQAQYAYQRLVQWGYLK